jgi:hypothetical protein
MAFFLEMLVIEPPPDNQATAIAQMCKRFTYDDAVRLYVPPRQQPRAGRDA